MAEIIFYAKPNCVNNHKQIKLLRAAGHRVIERDILAEAWTAERLHGYFGSAPVPEWFNPTAPAIQSNTVRPDGLSAPQALAAMIRDPLLIRRPLMDIGDRALCGFRKDELDHWIGLSPAEGHEQEMRQLSRDTITTCPFLGTTVNCDAPEAS